MKGLIIGAAIVLGAIGCSNMKSGGENKVNDLTEELLSKTVVSNATVQEWISGIEGGKNTMEFSLNIETGAEFIKPDSLFYLDYKCKLVLEDSTNSLYTIKTRKIDDIKRTKEVKSIVISFKNTELTYSFSEIDLKRLEPVYMP